MTSSTPTLRDVAAEAGVSPMTASNALRGEARRQGIDPRQT